MFKELVFSLKAIELFLGLDYHRDEEKNQIY
jgi:hypothetical protein